MIYLGINGSAGKMGSLICGKILDENDMAITNAFESKSSPNIGEDLGTAIGIEDWNIKISEIDFNEKPKMNILIDFSSREGFQNALEYAYKKGIGFVSGSTGLNADDLGKMKAYSKKIPVLYSTNMSQGINSIILLLENMRDILNDRKRDIEIIEYHHNKKKDAPSGTALTLAEKISEISKRKVRVSGDAPFPRHDEIRIHSLRIGTVPGYHKIIISGAGETIELSHSADSRETFVNGVIKGIKFLSKKKNGFFNMIDVFRED